MKCSRCFCFVATVRYRNMLQDMGNPELQQRRWLVTITFQQDGTLLHFARETTFYIISCAFHTRWRPLTQQEYEVLTLFLFRSYSPLSKHVTRYGHSKTQTALIPHYNNISTRWCSSSDCKNFLQHHFTESCIISPVFPTRWPPRSSDLIPCNFWLWDYLKDKVYRGNTRNLAHLKKQIILHALNIGSVAYRNGLCYNSVLHVGPVAKWTHRKPPVNASIISALLCYYSRFTLTL